MGAKVIQPSFAAGELAPSLAARVDLAKYRIGARTMKNFLVHPHGGASNRPGTIFVAEAAGEGRLIPFNFNAEQAYVLEFTNVKMRIVKDGGMVVYPEGHEHAGDIVEVTSPFALADLPTLKFVQSADTLFFTHPSYPPYTLTRTDHHLWTFAAMSFSVDIAAPIGLTATRSSGYNTGTTNLSYKVAAVNAAGEESYPSSPVAISAVRPWPSGGYVTLTWKESTGAVSYNIYKSSRGNWGLIGTVYIGDAITETTAELWTKLTSGTVIHSTEDNDSYTAEKAFDGNIYSFFRSDETGSNVNDVAYVGKNFGSAKAVTKVRAKVTGVYAYDIEYSANGTDWSVAASVTGLTPSSTAWVETTFESQTKQYWRILAQTGATSQHFCVYELEIYQYTASGTSSRFQFIDDNIEPQTSIGPQEPATPFDGSDDYPGAVSIHQQRMVFGRTNNQPQTVWLSRSGAFNNMATSFPTQDDDAIEATIASRKVNEVRHMVPLENLLVFTAGATWVMSAGANSDTVTPTSIQFKAVDYRGIADQPPVVIGRSVLFVQRDGAAVRELEYQLQADGLVSNNLSVLAGHLFADGYTVKEWAYQQAPDSVVWMVRSDGVLLGFTYLKEQEVWAWHWHTTQGQFESVAAIDGVDLDNVYFIVKRSINGKQVRYIERLAQRIPKGGRADIAAPSILQINDLGVASGGTSVFTYVDEDGVRTATDSGGNKASRVWPLFNILSPTDGAEHVSLTPTIQWANAAGNSGYVVVISESDTLVMDGLTVDLEDAGVVWSKDDVATNATTATVDVPLDEYTTYYVWVFAKVGTRLVVAANAEIEFLTTATITLDDTLADGTVGAAYTGAIAATGGTEPYIYAVTSGALPAGLTLASNGAVTGTPTTAETAAFTVTATDANGDTGSRAYSVTVVEAAPLGVRIQGYNNSTTFAGHGLPTWDSGFYFNGAFPVRGYDGVHYSYEQVVGWESTDWTAALAVTRGRPDVSWNGNAYQLRVAAYGDGGSNEELWIGTSATITGVYTKTSGEAPVASLTVEGYTP